MALANPPSRVKSVVRRDADRLVCSAIAQVFWSFGGSVHDLAGIHPAFGIESLLHSLEIAL
jgi:hypothetical protein